VLRRVAVLRGASVRDLYAATVRTRAVCQAGRALAVNARCGILPWLCVCATLGLCGRVRAAARLAAVVAL
jgi:hypothetical protein